MLHIHCHIGQNTSSSTKCVFFYFNIPVPLNLEIWHPKKRTKLPELGSWGGGGAGDSSNARKKTFFFYWSPPLVSQLMSDKGREWSDFGPIKRRWWVIIRSGWLYVRAPRANKITDLITAKMRCEILHWSIGQGVPCQHKHQGILVLCHFQTASEDFLQYDSSVRPGHRLWFSSESRSQHNPYRRSWLQSQ